LSSKDKVLGAILFVTMIYNSLSFSLIESDLSWLWRNVLRQMTPSLS